MTREQKLSGPNDSVREYREKEDCIYCKGTRKVYMNHHPIDCPGCKETIKDKKEYMTEQGWKFNKGKE